MRRHVCVIDQSTTGQRQTTGRISRVVEGEKSGFGFSDRNPSWYDLWAFLQINKLSRSYASLSLSSIHTPPASLISRSSLSLYIRVCVYIYSLFSFVTLFFYGFAVPLPTFLCIILSYFSKDIYEMVLM